MCVFKSIYRVVFCVCNGVCSSGGNHSLCPLSNILSPVNSSIITHNVNIPLQFLCRFEHISVCVRVSVYFCV